MSNVKKERKNEIVPKKAESLELKKKNFVTFLPIEKHTLDTSAGKQLS